LAPPLTPPRPIVGVGLSVSFSQIKFPKRPPIRHQGWICDPDGNFFNSIHRESVFGGRVACPPFPRKLDDPLNLRCLRRISLSLLDVLLVCPFGPPGAFTLLFALFELFYLNYFFFPQRSDVGRLTASLFSLVLLTNLRFGLPMLR